MYAVSLLYFVVIIKFTKDIFEPIFSEELSNKNNKRTIIS